MIIIEHDYDNLKKKKKGLLYWGLNIKYTEHNLSVRC